MLTLQEAECYCNYEPYAPYEEEQDYIESESEPVLAPLISVVGASGGVGRSTIALLCAALAAKTDIDVALVEGDLQFGDYGLWLGLDEKSPNLANDGIPTPTKIGNLSVYKAPLFPETAEEISDALVVKVSEIRKQHELVFADTSAFWSGFTACLLTESDLYLMLNDRRVASVIGAVRASELCSRLGIPFSRMICVYNRWNARATLNANEVRQGLGAEEIYCIPDGKDAVNDLISSGNLDELIESENSMVHGVQELLANILPYTGHLYADAPLPRKGGLFR